MDAVAIELNGEFLDLPDTPLRYELINSMFITDIYQGDYSFPYTLPATPKNLRMLGFANSIDLTGRTTEFEKVYLSVLGLPKFKTKLIISSAKNNSISINLVGGVAALPNAEKTLAEMYGDKEYDLGNSQPAILDSAKKATEEGDWTKYGFCFPPFYAPNFYAGKNPYFLGYPNRVDSTTGNIKGNGTDYVNAKYNLVPWLFLFEIMNSIFKDAGLIPSGTFWEDPELKTLICSSNRAIEFRGVGYNTRAVNNVPIDYNINGQRVEFNLSVAPPGVGSPEYQRARRTFDNPGAWDDANDQYIIRNSGTHVFTLDFNLVSYFTTLLIEPNIIKGGYIRMYFDGNLEKEWEVPDSKERKVKVNLLGGLFGGGSGPNRDSFSFSYEKYFAPGDILKSVYFDYYRPTPTFMQTGSYIHVDESILNVVVTPDAATLGAAPSSYVKFKDHVPDMKVKEFLTEIKKYGVSLNFDRLNEVILDKVNSVLTSRETVDITRHSEPGYDLNMEEKNDGSKIHYEFPPDEKTDLQISPDLILNEVTRFEDLPVPNKEGAAAVVSITNEVYKVVKEGADPLKWKLAGYNYKPFQIGKGQNDISISIAPTQMCIGNNEGGTSDQNKALMPYFPGTGSSDLFDLGINPLTPRLAFWRGKNFIDNQSSPKGGNYVLASTGVENINGVIVGDYTFRLDKKESVPRMLSERLLLAMNNGEVLEKLIYPDTKLFQKINSTTRIDSDSNFFLLKSMSVLVSKKFIQLKAYLLKL